LAVPSVDTSSSSNSKTRAHLVLRESLDKIGSAMSGYLLTGYEIDRAFNDLAIAVTSPMLPVREIEEQLSVLSARIPSSLYSFIDGLLTEFKQKCDAQAGSGAETRYVQKFSPSVLCLSVQA
jgi:hypothetical protein